MALNRPQTSKPRGICKYYKTQRGCFAGNACKFFHGDPSSTSQPESPSGPQVLLTPYDSAKMCRYFANGYCKRGANCWFRHIIKQDRKTYSSVSEPEEEELLCSICLEKPVTFGLLGGCSHVFCIQCIRQWRDPENKSGDLASSSNTKKCPMCRAPSKFITPSSRFWKEGEEDKATVMQAYKESMSRVPCRYFQETKAKKPFCPFGKDCFYQHLNDDGTKHVFRDSIDVCMKIHSSRRNQGLRSIIDITVDYDMLGRNSNRRLQFTVDDEINDPAVISTSHEDHGRSRARRRGLQGGSRPSDITELERNLDIIISENPTADDLFREILVENIYLFFRQHPSYRDDGGDSNSTQASEENRRNQRFMEHMRVMTEQFVASIRTNEPLESPPPLEPHVDEPDDEDGEPPFVTDGRGRVVWSAAGRRGESGDVL